MVDPGADGDVVSNHVERQLNPTQSTLLMAPAVGSADVLSGWRRDTRAGIIAARALGADAEMIGWAYLCRQMAAGERSVERVVELMCDG